MLNYFYLIFNDPSLNSKYNYINEESQVKKIFFYININLFIYNNIHKTWTIIPLISVHNTLIYQSLQIDLSIEILKIYLIN